MGAVATLPGLAAGEGPGNLGVQGRSFGLGLLKANSSQSPSVTPCPSGTFSRASSDTKPPHQGCSQGGEGSPQPRGQPGVR